MGNDFFLKKLKYDFYQSHYLLYTSNCVKVLVKDKKKDRQKAIFAGLVLYIIYRILKR